MSFIGSSAASLKAFSKLHSTSAGAHKLRLKSVFLSHSAALSTAAPTTLPPWRLHEEASPKPSHQEEAKVEPAPPQQRTPLRRLKPLRERIVILGCGWGGFRAYLDLDTKKYDILLISPRNHYLFTPLLPSTATGTLEFRSIVEPARKARKNTRYLMAYARGVDVDTQEVLINADWFEEGEKEKRIPYDKLIIATGARNNTFGIPGVVENAMFLKELSHARNIRRKIIECFEDASYPDMTEEFRKQKMHFVIVGGGPTGVEFAAELHDFVMEDLRKAFPELSPYIRMTLIEASEHMLGMFNKDLVNYTNSFFARQNINVQTKAVVKEVKPDEIVLSSGERIPYGLCVWSTGVSPRPFIQDLTFEKDSHGRLVTDEYLRVKGQNNVFAIGDCAAIEDHPLPPTAQVAERKGIYLGKAINKHPSNIEDYQPFDYRHAGMMTYIGSYRALVDMGESKWSGAGRLAFLLWRSAYFSKQVSWRNRFLIFMHWTKTFFFGRDISRF